MAYETPTLLDRCLTSLARGSVRGERIGRVVVVDNSATGACSRIAAGHDRVELIKSPSNLGFGRGANLGLSATRGGSRYVLILNADTEVQPGAVDALIDHLAAHPSAAVAGPLLTDEIGDFQASCGSFPTPWGVLLAQSGLWRIAGRLTGRPGAVPFRNPVVGGAVPWVLGAALMIDRDAIERVGGFDPGFHMYFEEVDLSRRLLRIRRETHFVPEATVAHVGAASTCQSSAMERHMYSSLARHLRLHGRPADVTRLRMVVAAVTLAHLARAVLRSESREPWRGILSDALSGWSG